MNAMSLYYRACADCGYDHSYEPELAKQWHDGLINRAGKPLTKVNNMSKPFKRKTKVTKEIRNGEERIVLENFPAMVSFEPAEARKVANKIRKLTPKPELNWQVVHKGGDGKLKVVRSFESKIQANVHLSTIVFDSDLYSVRERPKKLSERKDIVSIDWVLNTLAGMRFENAALGDAYDHIKVRAKIAGIEVPK